MHQLFSKNAGWWLLLLALSLLAGSLLQSKGFPAAFLVGPMVLAIVFSLFGAGLKVRRPFFYGAQSLIGCAVANSITAAIVGTVCKDWAVLFLIAGGAVLAGALVGWALVKCGTLPGTTAAWGSTPGGASAMVAMAEEYGADARLVAIMQYLRVLVVVLTASLVSHFFLGAESSVPGLAATPSFAAPSFSWGSSYWQPLLLTLSVAGTGAIVGPWLGIPAGAMLVPMLLGSVLHARGLADVFMPFWLQAGASVLLGWYVGLGFSRSLLVSAFRMLPRLLFSTVLLICLCGLSAWLLVAVVHTDPLTAYLATTPGGLDSVILIAMGSQADIQFVVAAQTLRLFVVILVGPAIARLICRYA